MEQEETACPLSNCDNLLGHISSKDNRAKWHVKSTSREQCAASHYAVNSRTVLAGHRGVFAAQQQVHPLCFSRTALVPTTYCALLASYRDWPPYFVVVRLLCSQWHNGLHNSQWINWGDTRHLVHTKGSIVWVQHWLLLRVSVPASGKMWLAAVAWSRRTELISLSVSPCHDSSGGLLEDCVFYSSTDVSLRAHKYSSIHF